MYIFIRSNDANPDPRLQKYIDYAKKKKIAYKVIAWDRLGENTSLPNYIYFRKEAPFGRGYKNIPSKFLWSLFLIKQLILYRKQYKYIHACDIDTAAPSYIAKTFLRKKINFDVFDWVSDGNKNGIIPFFVSKIENFIFQKSDNVIICENYRINQIKPKHQREYLVLPNIPNVDFQEDIEVRKKIFECKEKYTYLLSYVGIFDNNRGLEDILKFVSQNPSVALHIAGFGLNEAIVKEYSEKNENIIYWGKVSYNKGLNIMKECDFIVALYYLTNPIHRFAAPNKFYESLFLGKPIITNYGTALSEKVESYNTGILVDELTKNFEKISQVTEQEILEMGKNATLYWEKEFKDYTGRFMESYFKEDKHLNDVKY